MGKYSYFHNFPEQIDEGGGGLTHFFCCIHPGQYEDSTLKRLEMSAKKNQSDKIVCQMYFYTEIENYTYFSHNSIVTKNVCVGYHKL